MLSALCAVTRVCVEALLRARRKQCEQRGANATIRCVCDGLGTGIPFACVTPQKPSALRFLCTSVLASP